MKHSFEITKRIDENILKNLKQKLYLGYEKIVNLLIENGANVNNLNHDNDTSLIVAAAQGNFSFFNESKINLQIKLLNQGTRKLLKC